MPNIFDKKGFTLFEIITAIALFSIVVLLTGTLFDLAQKSYNRSINQSELIQNVRVCLDRLSRELRQADALETDLSTATSSEIFFQDGHNLDEITYIKYYLNDTDLMRSHLAYYFSSDPSTYVSRESLDAFGNPPIELTLENRIVGEYFNDLKFSGPEGLITISISLTKQMNNLDINTKIYIRDW